MEAIKYYPGSIGEIIQGRAFGKDILLSCPINLFTKVRVFESSDPSLKKNYPKCNNFMRNILNSWGYDGLNNKLDIEISSEIPISKGFASSTADITALYLCLTELIKKEHNEKELIRQAINIEPTDSIIFKEMTLFDYKSGSYKESIGSYLEFYILVFEGKKVIDTVEFNNNIKSPLACIDDLIPDLKKAVKEKDIIKLGSISNESILRNRHRLNYNIFKEIKKIKEITNGAGIIGAHSGDLLGIIYEDEAELKKALSYKDSITAYSGYPLKTINKLNYNK